MLTLCVCQSINSVSESEGKLFRCQKGDNGGVPIGRCVCLSSDLNPQALSGVLSPSLSAQILNWEVI